MREINAAFQAIRHAPLRYHIEGHPRVVSRAAAAGRAVPHETVPLTDHTEWWLRFSAGAMLGVVVNVVLMCGGTDIPTPLWVMVPMITGFLSAVLGNAFWNLVIESLWWIDFP